MKFVIRDDDLSFFSTPADVRRWYADVFAQQVPVGFSAIPRVKPSGDAHNIETQNPDKEYPISDNKELVAYVMGNPLIEILQHGTTHETRNGVFEYAGEVPRGEAARGREELERAFGAQVHIFVPPHDWIDTSGVHSVEAARMDIIRGRGAGLRNFILRWQYVSIFFRMLWFRATNSRAGKPPAYPYVLDFGNHRELCSYRLEDIDVFAGLEYAHKKDGIFVVVTHLHFYTPEKKELLLQLIARARELGAEFVRPSEVLK